jgi:hypothetical protein
MQGLWIEVRAVGPLDCPEGRVQLHSVEELQVLQRTEHFPCQDRSEIDSLAGAVIEPQGQRIGAHDVDLLDAMDSVTRGLILRSPCAKRQKRGLLESGEDEVRALTKTPPSKLALHATIQRIDGARAAS